LNARPVKHPAVFNFQLHFPRRQLTPPHPQPSVPAKNSARITALAITQPHAQTIANNAGVATEDKIAL
jgi:hypothetical protein